MASHGQIQDLKLYIPFIDFAARLDKNKFSKLVLIKEWILENRKFSVKDLERLKQSIVVQYKQLLFDKNVIMPNNIVEIFNLETTTKVEIIDLCSDDERSAQSKESSKPLSLKVNKNKTEIIKKNDVYLSDGEIIDSDNEVISPVTKKPASFHIQTREIKTSDRENRKKQKTDKTVKTGTIRVNSKTASETLNNDENSNEINIRKGVKELCSKQKSITCVENLVQPDKDDETESIFNRIEIICEKVESKTKNSVECMTISDTSLDESTFELLTNVGKPTEALAEENSAQSKADEQIFTRRSNKTEISSNKNDAISETKAKKTRKKRVRSRENSNSDVFVDLSSDEEIVVSKPIILKSPQKKDADNIVSIDDTDKLNDKIVNRDITESQNKNSSPIDASKKYEKMDINELRSIFKKLTQGSSIDFDRFLDEVSQGEEYISSSPLNNSYYCDDKLETCVTPESSSAYMHVKEQNESVVTENIFVRRTAPQVPSEIQQTVPSLTQQNLHTNFPPIFPIINQISTPQPNVQPVTVANSYPIIYINGRKINLNDPRVKNHLLSFQNPSASKEPTHTQTNDQCVHPPYQKQQNNFPKGPLRAVTYGEYKRRKAEEAEELKRRKQAKNQARLENLNNQDNITKEDNITKPKSGLNKNELNCDSSQGDPTVEITRCKEPNKSKREQNENTEKMVEMLGLESENVKNSSNKSNRKQLTRSKKKKNYTSTTRVLKELECTVKGFDRLEDYMPQSLSGKRICSENARSAIAKQLNGHQIHSEVLTLERKNNKRNRISVRRSSMSISLEQNNISQNSSAPIAKRRKTCTEVSIATLLQDSSSESTEETTLRQNSTLMKSVNQNESSSSDTDTFDFDEFKYRKAKALALKSQPFVLLHRLTNIEINKHLKRNQRSHVPPEKMSLNVKLVEKTTRAIIEIDNKSTPAATKTKPYDYLPNVDILMTERNTNSCALCKAKPVNLVNHYIRTHKTEPYISRLSINELEDLQLNCPFAIPASSSNARVPKYKVQCLFCREELIDRFINFHTHFSAHTGEYAFKCSNCDLKKPYRSDIISHKHNAKSCRNAHIQKLYVYPTNLMVIYLHCCKLCNFVQLNAANVFKHLREQHAKRGDDAIYVQRYIAAAINDAEIVNELFPEEEEDFLAGEASFVSNEENEVEANCSELEIKPDLSPYACGLDDSYIKNTPNTKKSSIPSANIITTNATSFLNNKSETNGTAVELPRPIVIKEMITEINNLKNEPSLNCNVARLHYRNYPSNVHYYGLFKCMATDCFFSTDDEVEILKHLNDHGSSEYPPSGWLECSYCELRDKEYKQANDLIAHIKLRHSHNRFQCVSCCYRTCVPGNVVIHCAKLHNAPTPIYVYRCNGEIVTEDNKLSAMQTFMLTNVKKVLCRYCQQGFYATSALRYHLSRNHGSFNDESQLTSEYSCIYCGKDFAQKSDIQEHTALEHPDEFAYACRRVLKNTEIEDAIENLQLLSVEEKIPLTYIREALSSSVSVQMSHLSKERVMNTSDLYLTKQEHCSLDSGTESVAPENFEEQTDLKPSAEELVSLAEESLRALLNKLTFKTGLSPDRLYHCPVATCGGFFSTHALWSRHMTFKHNCLIAPCPHCNTNSEFALSEFSQHFEQHCRHLYVCFHCSESFVNENSIIVHFQTSHSKGENFRFEMFKFNLMHSYRVIVSESVSTERLELCETMQNTVAERLKQQANEESYKVLSKWLVRTSADWLYDYPTVNRNNTKNCIVRGCPFKTRKIEELFQHWAATHEIAGDFKCSRCSLQINNVCNWKPIIEHVRMHDSSYICCVCNYYHIDRNMFSAHASQEHNSRDVPFVGLFHSNEAAYVGVGIIFAASCKTFSTTRVCFFCKATNLTLENLSKHFRQEHSISMQHYCEICGISFKSLTEVDGHHSSRHEGKELKLRCEFVSKKQIRVCSSFPLSLEVMNDNDIKGSVIKKAEEANQSNLEACVNEFAVNGLRVKEELPDDGGHTSGSDLEIIEEDDLVRAVELEARRIEQNKKAEDVPLIRVKNLFKSNITAIPPVSSSIASPAINIPKSITVKPISHISSKPSIFTLPTPINATINNAPLPHYSSSMKTITSVGEKDYAHRPLLHQHRYNNASISTQQSNEPTNFSASINACKPIHSQQPGGNHLSYPILNIDQETMRTLSNTQQQYPHEQYMHAQQYMHSQQQYQHTQQQQQQNQHIQQLDAIQYSVSSQQIRADGQQKAPPYKNVTILRKRLSPTFTHQTTVNNEQQNFVDLLSPAPSFTQPYTSQTTQLSPNITKLAIPESITVRLSSHVNENKRLMSPIMPVNSNPIHSQLIHSQNSNSHHIGLPTEQLSPAFPNWTQRHQ